jgi:hypothetical protein
LRFESIIRFSHSHSLHGVVSDQNIAAMFSPSFILYMYTIVNFFTKYLKYDAREHVFQFHNEFVFHVLKNIN